MDGRACNNAVDGIGMGSEGSSISMSGIGGGLIPSYRSLSSSGSLSGMFWSGISGGVIHAKASF
eukprot:15361638-Ditylum_brightwellii.AAC.2